jgi:general secretion pathway protein C
MLAKNKLQIKEEMPRQIHIIFNLLALFVIIYIVVDTFYRVVGVELHQAAGPKVVMLQGVASQTARPLVTPDYDKIVARNIFGATEKAEPLPLEERQQEEEQALEGLEETTLQLALLGTAAGDSASARAIIMDKKEKKQDIYRVGDSVQGAEIRQILRGKVVLRHGEKDEVLTMAEDTAAAAQPPAAPADLRSRGVTRRAARGRATPDAEEAEEEAPPPEVSDESGEVEEEVIPIAQDELQGSINDLNQLMTQVRIRPYFRGGKPEGLIVSQIQGDSIFAKLGLMNGDIIASVNGQQMSTPEEAFQLYNSLNSASQVTVEVTRRGQKKKFTYDIR